MSNLIKKYPFLAWVLGIALAVTISVPFSSWIATRNTERYVRETFSEPLIGVKNNTDSLLIIIKDFQRILVEEEEDAKNE